MYEYPPVIATNRSPAEAIGHDHEAFCAIYRRYFLARSASRSDGKEFAGKFRDEDDALIFRSAIKKLEAHGYVPMGLDDKGNTRFAARLQSGVDLMFWDDNTYGGVPPMSELAKMSPGEIKNLFHRTVGAIGATQAADNRNRG